MHERTSANVLRTIFAILTTLFLVSILGVLVIKACFFGRSSIKGFFLSDAVIEKELEEFGNDYPKGFDARDFFMEFNAFTVDSILDSVEKGRVKIDEDRMDEILDEYVEGFAANQDVSLDDLDRFREEYRDMITESFEDLKESFNEPLAAYYESRLIIYGYVYGSAAVCVILFVITLILSKNKFLPFKSCGLALTISSALNCLVTVLVWFVFNFGMDEITKDKDEFTELIADYIRKASVRSNIIMFELLALGIVMLVAFGIMAKKYARNNAEDETDADHYSSDYMAVTDEYRYRMLENDLDSDNNYDKYSDEDLE